MLVAAGLAVLLVLGMAGVWAYASLSACTDEQRAIFEEFPHYGGRQLEPERSWATGHCGASFYTADSEEEVFAYYLEKLRENGWEVEIVPNRLRS